MPVLTLVRSAVAGAALALLAVCAPPPAAAVQDLTGLPDTVDPARPLVAAVALTAWALATWLAVAGLLTLLSRAPGLLGRAGSALVRRWAPAAVRRSLEVALGITAATGAVGAGTAHALPVPLPTDTAPPAVDRPSATASFDLDWPTTAPPSGSTRAPSAAPTGAPRSADGASPSPADTAQPPATERPHVPAARPAHPRADERPPQPRSSGAAGGPSVTRPTDLPRAGPVEGDRTAAGAQAAPAPRPRPPSQTGGGALTAVVVRPGDTLWGLAEASLRRAGVEQPTDRRIAQTWPRWWAANRDVIGDDPDLILPGTVLSPPADRAAGTTAGP